MKRRILYILVMILVAPLILKAEEVNLALDEAIAIALRDNRDILLKAQDLQKAKAKIAEARAGLLPTLTFTGSWAQTRGYYSKEVGQASGQATLKQYLYKGGSVVNTIKYNEYGFSITQALLDKTKLEVVLDVQKAFYTLLLAGELANLNKGILENTQEHLDFLRSRYAKGQASESDILAVESALSTVSQAYEAALNQIDAARALLNNLLYLSPDTAVKPEAKFNYEIQEVAYDAAFLAAMKMRPEIRQYAAQMQADRKSIEIAKAGSRPTIYASWDYYSRSHSQGVMGPVKNWNDYSVIGITFSSPVFDGWATKQKVEQAIIDLKETQLLKEKAVQDIALELKNAYLDLENALNKIKASASQLDLYKDTLSVAEKKYQAGIASLLGLHDASLSYEVALFNQKEAIYDYILAKASFEKAMGE